MNIGITGAYGLIGWHLRCHLSALTDHEVVPAGRQDFAGPEQLDAFTSQCDTIVHLAGMNRGDDDEIFATNVGLAEALVDSVDRTRRTRDIVFSSSTHIDGPSRYGASKRAAAEVFEKWARDSNAHFTNLVLPHVFGECGQPHYNSVVSTFCHEIANEGTPEVLSDSDLSLLHAQDASAAILRAVEAPGETEIRVLGTPITVQTLLDRLKALAADYAAGILPSLTDRLTLRLFNTYRSYLYPERYPVALTLHTDARGSLFEAVKGHNGGQTFVSTTHPGITRGNHYHLAKVERFLVIGGQARIDIRKLFSDEVHSFNVSGEEPQVIDIPTLHTHNITNTGDRDLTTLFWANEIFDPERPDTYALDV